MPNLVFLLCLGLVLATLLGWGFKHLPGERWQMLAAVPIRKNRTNNWQGVNLTYYGFFIATSQLVSLVLLVILLGATGVSISGAMLAIFLMLAFCLPSARLVAMVVEKKRHTFTTGGASFIGILLAPWSIMVINKLLAPDILLPLIPILAAMSIAYALGEGLGRLGCISFGCCYGKPVKDCHKIFQRLFSRTGCIFYGATKKVAYEAQLTGQKLVPIQAITSILYTCGALAGSFLFLKGCFTPALLFTLVLTQVWRILSEGLRADFRGFGRISTYQIMGILSVLYVMVVLGIVNTPPNIIPEISCGIMALWNPAVILTLQLLWLIFFFIFGRSTVTTATISFDLIKKHI
jgi:hypothetical protein